jgi:hypothetical protein
MADKYGGGFPPNPFNSTAGGSFIPRDPFKLKLNSADHFHES